MPYQKKSSKGSSKSAKTKDAAKQAKSTKKSSSKKKSSKNSQTSAQKKAQQEQQRKKDAAHAKEQKYAQQQKEKAQKAEAAANKRAQASAADAAQAKKDAAAAKGREKKANSALLQANQAKQAQADRAASAEKERDVLQAESLIKEQANIALNTRNISLTSKIEMFESEEAKMARKINEQTLKMQEQAQAVLDALNDEADEPPVVIDGISSGYASPAPAEKLYQDQTAVEIDIDTIDNLDDLSISILRPEILINHKGAYKAKDNSSGIGSNKYLDLFAGNVLRELLHSDAAVYSYTQLQDSDPDLIDAASQRVENVHTQLEGEIESLVSYRSMINQAIIALDLHQCSEEIGSLMIDGVTEVMQPEDGFVEESNIFWIFPIIFTIAEWGFDFVSSATLIARSRASCASSVCFAR